MNEKEIDELARAVDELAGVITAVDDVRGILQKVGGTEGFQEQLNEIARTLEAVFDALSKKLEANQ